MKTVKIQDSCMTSAAASLGEANAAIAAAKKRADGAKEMICRILREQRNIDVAAMEIGEIVNVDGIVIIEIGKQSRFDQADFRVRCPGLYADFTRDFRMEKYKPIV